MSGKRVGLAVCLSVCLASCTGMVQKMPPPSVYDFGPVLQEKATNSRGGIVLEVRSPSWFETLGVDYRLAYDDPLRPREYANSRWAANPATLLARRLVPQLGLAGLAGDVAAGCLLRVELYEFSQVFHSSTESRGVIHARLSLIDAKRRPLADWRVTVERPAATPDARGGVGALVAAGDDLGQVIGHWLVDAEQTGAMASCRTTALTD